MKIRMLKSAASAAGSFQAGKVYEIDGGIAGPLIAAGAAVCVDAAPKVEAAVVAEEVETATVDDGPGDHAAPPDLASMTKDELKALADSRGIEVTRKKGKGDPLKADYVRALGG